MDYKTILYFILTKIIYLSAFYLDDGDFYIFYEYLNYESAISLFTSAKNKWWSFIFSVISTTSVRHFLAPVALRLAFRLYQHETTLEDERLNGKKISFCSYHLYLPFATRGQSLIYYLLYFCLQTPTPLKTCCIWFLPQEERKQMPSCGTKRREKTFETKCFTCWTITTATIIWSGIVSFS